MIFLRTILGGLLVFSTLTSCADIEFLQKARYEKLQELSELGAKIHKEKELIRSLNREINNYFELWADHFKLSDVEKKNKEIEISMYAKNIEQDLNTKQIENIFSVNDLFGRHEDGLPAFDEFKFWAIRNNFEYDLLRELVSSYHRCLAELIVIKNELKNVQIR